MGYISILNVLNRCGIKLHKMGDNYITNCPLHPGDDTASFIVYPKNNSWCCFGKCLGKGDHKNGGGAVEFVKQYYNLSFKDSVKWMQNNFPESLIIQQEYIVQKTPHPVKEVPNILVTYWHSILGDNREYFKRRGFTDETIDTQMLGWNGSRYSIPIWDGEPQNSECLGVRLRKSEFSKKDEPKYIGVPGFNNSSVVWGKWYCKGKKSIFCTAGEFDAMMMVQLGLPAFSVVNGICSISTYPDDWPSLWFPDSKSLVICFDLGEEMQATKLSYEWNKYKGTMSSKIYLWDSSLGVKDFCEFNLKFGTEAKSKFFKLLELQKIYL